MRDHTALCHGPASRRWSRLHRGAASVLLGVALSATAPGVLHANEVALHGADSVFVAPEVAVIWAVLKQPQGDKAAVWMRLVNTTRKFTHFSVDGVDPFSKKRERVEKGGSIAQELRIQADRDTFADLTSREIHFYATEQDWKSEKPALTVYYLGVPDTTPEFTDKAVMDGYLGKVPLVPHKTDAKR